MYHKIIYCQTIPVVFTCLTTIYLTEKFIINFHHMWNSIGSTIITHGKQQD